ncbi:conserved Plasmodium protein, unknown function [Plasmodium vivax]|uniref:Uncharacterized protein n=6 Tax=Plasmodium vivax TaxID=5855 RepID=A5KDS4_PLAVS|nr:hypothetical protein PVX_110845 [Plasmodium vivax]KMZ81602.1 hypothetical protein PVIIG_04691 [Plasmodium vivax India VII]KMZ87818.1 hypothetical protein PVBG_05069 [Plasmodium vivax Brazil I]KMZ94078.1 hypothetical protein PVMG_02304 [Plasmodium vivax Mauritania I]KNA00628.1 hypothetical protein PVNG_03225 [Plasmodium vivax North Korean]EDL42370.1 hypothetical protein PVX_110845 [Plasmodium vivax]|eukprot:XP_001608394.1 hypothetical protein [Plasmodium vivax Sal-1]
MFVPFDLALTNHIRRSFLTLSGVLLAKRTWQTNMKRKTYRSKKRKKYIRLGETLIRIQ